MKIKVIGIGGIGCCLLPILGRFLTYNVQDTELTLIDGDNFEARNNACQAYALEGGNKAEVAAERLRQEFPELSVSFEPQFVTEENVVRLIREDDWIFLCVHDYGTRRLVSDRCEELENVLLISGGNDQTDGNIQVHRRRDGQNLTLPVSNPLHPEIQQALYPDFDRVGCDQEVVSKPQLLITNNFIAALMLNAFYGNLQGGTAYGEVYGDILRNSAVPTERKPQDFTGRQEESVCHEPQ